MTKHFYRFRSAENLLGKRQELENQEIYFASPEQLNDPMEGFRNIVWKGDKIAWENLFFHYTFCLEHIYSRIIIGTKEELGTGDIPIYDSAHLLPTEKYRKSIKEIKKNLLKNKEISSFIDLVAQRTASASRSELSFYLDCIHLPALKIIIDHFIERGISPNEDRIPDDAYSTIRNIKNENLFKSLEEPSSVEPYHQEILNIILRIKIQKKEETVLQESISNELATAQKNKNFLFFQFPEIYVKKIEELIYPKWYTSCFMSDYKNSSVWGHYGDNHNGICLIFNSEKIENEATLKLSGIVGEGSKGLIYGDQNMKLHKIVYGGDFPEFDFFSNLGNLPMHTLNTMWYMDDENNISTCANQIYNDEHKWRSDYWQRFIEGISKKSKDWEYENEYRLVLHSNIFDLTEKRRRILTYEFSSLAGIIFGINTSHENKLKTIRVIQEKCKNSSREDFKFYQAYYCTKDHCIKKLEISLRNLLD